MGMANALTLDTSLLLQDAVDYMNSIYEQASALFALYSRLTEHAQKQVIADEFCIALKASLHTEVELVYPAVKPVADNLAVVSAAVTSQSVLVYLINEIFQMEKDSAVFDLKIQLLGGQFKQHVQLIRAHIFQYISYCHFLSPHLLRTRFDACKDQLIEQYAQR